MSEKTIALKPSKRRAPLEVADQNYETDKVTANGKTKVKLISVKKMKDGRVKRSLVNTFKSEALANQEIEKLKSKTANEPRRARRA